MQVKVASEQTEEHRPINHIECAIDETLAQYILLSAFYFAYFQFHVEWVLQYMTNVNGGGWRTNILAGKRQDAFAIRLMSSYEGEEDGTGNLITVGIRESATIKE